MCVICDNMAAKITFLRFQTEIVPDDKVIFTIFAALYLIRKEQAFLYEQQ